MTPGATPTLALPDERDVRDLETFVARARRVEPSGAIRLAAHGSVLAATVCLVPGSGLLGEGTVLGMRVGALAEEADLDVVVPFDAVTDRLARMRREAGTRFAVPPMTVAPPWAALSPPRSGWDPRGIVPPEDLRNGALAGIDEITAGAPAGSGAAAVADLRRRVWSRALPLGERQQGERQHSERQHSERQHGQRQHSERQHSERQDGEMRPVGPGEGAGAPAAAAVEPAAGPDGGRAGAAAPVAGLAFGAHVLGFLRAEPATWHVAGRWQRLSTPAGHVLAR